MTSDGERAKIANIVGLGLVGGSIGLALRLHGFEVAGTDVNSTREREALARGVIDSVGVLPDAAVSFVCTPAARVAEVASDLLRRTSGPVTDVGSVKQPVVDSIGDPRFLGGHPMAGSEIDGLDGADADLFEGAVWVLTPTKDTADRTFTAVAELVKMLGADVMSMSADRHDDLVAVVSHAPHLLAATLMSVANRRSTEDSTVLRLAAGGFRDMTRIAAGNPRIWLDICQMNRDAIVDVLGELIDGLGDVSSAVSGSDARALQRTLEGARQARLNLPGRLPSELALHEVRIPIPDRPGSAAEVFTLAGELGVNIHDFEVVHSSEGDRGVVVLLVASTHAELLRGGLMARGFKPGLQPLT